MGLSMINILHEQAERVQCSVLYLYQVEYSIFSKIPNDVVDSVFLEITAAVLYDKDVGAGEFKERFKDYGYVTK